MKERERERGCRGKGEGRAGKEEVEVKERYTLVFRRDASLDPAQECSYVTRGCVTNFRWNVRQVRERE